jgi:peptidoglycan/LPS O-acetylase OafA/YrhL
MSVLHPTSLGVLGIATVLAGGVLAYRAHLKNRPALQTTAGLLLITGFACFGVAISLIVGLPLR